MSLPPPSQRPATVRKPSPKVTRMAGALALVLLLVGGLVPYVRAAREAGTPAPVTSGPSWMLRERETERAAGATDIVASLAAAVGNLAAVEQLARGRAVPPPPDPSTFASPTACARTYLPEVELPDEALDFMCTENDAWTLEREMYVRVAHRAGDGVRRYTRLGRFSIAAVAMVRAGCCVSPDPLLAVVPELWCGVLRDKVRALGPAPDARSIRDYDVALRCLREHGMRLPERWDRAPEERTVEAFEEFLVIARARGRPPTR